MAELKPCPFCGGERDAKKTWNRRCENENGAIYAVQQRHRV